MKTRKLKKSQVAKKVTKKVAKKTSKKVAKKTAKTKTKKSEKIPKSETVLKPEAVNLKNMTSDALFLHILKQMGKPSLVRDMVKTIKDNKLLTIAKKKLLAKFYASASHLNRDGVIKRKAVNHSMYEYRLPGWKVKGQNLAA